MSDTITIKKEVVARLLSDFDDLVHELEDEGLSEEAQRRIKEIEEGTTELLTKEEFLAKIQKAGF